MNNYSKQYLLKRVCDFRHNHAVVGGPQDRFEKHCSRARFSSWDLGDPSDRQKQNKTKQKIRYFSAVESNIHT